MDPERGDGRVRVTSSDVAAALRTVGVAPGDTAMFHSSLSSMGHVIGGADAVIVQDLGLFALSAEDGCDFGVDEHAKRRGDLCGA